MSENTLQPGTLYVVSTPIGNMEDVTLRALRILANVDVIACEDTRETGRFLAENDISGAQLLSYHGHSSERREDELLEKLAGGATVGLVSDRGTPGVSDPGERLIRHAVEAGVKVVPVPGATAVFTALAGAGVSMQPFVFVGFIPHKKGRQTLFAEIVAEKRTVVAYESPHRLMKTLEALKDSGKWMVVCRELTKLHEEFVRGDALSVYNEFVERGEVKGEIVLVISEARNT